MADIYKREPIRRELPSNYGELDAVNYLNLNNFKGLQVYDNPMIAEQNSTYSAKNIYVDEHSNLTVRPALQYVETRNRWEYETSNGITLTVVQKAGTADEYILSAKYMYNGQEITVDDYLIANPNISPIVENNNLYLLVQSISPKNNLAFIVLKPGQKNFVTDSGVVFLDDQKYSDISHYNILNKYTQMQVVRDEDDIGTVRPESLYSDNMSQYISGDAYYLSDKYTLGLSDSNATVYYRDGTAILPTYINFGSHMPRQNSNVGAYWPNVPSTLAAVWLDGTIVRCHEMSYQFHTIGRYDTDEYILDSTSGIRFRIASLDINGVLIDEQYVEKSHTELVDSGNILIGAMAFGFEQTAQNTANWALATVELKVNGNTSTPILKISDSSGAIVITRQLQEIPHSAYTDSFGTQYSGLRVGHKPVAMFSLSKNVCTVAVLWTYSGQDALGSYTLAKRCLLHSFSIQTRQFANVQHPADYFASYYSIAPVNSRLCNGFVVASQNRTIEQSESVPTTFGAFLCRINENDSSTSTFHQEWPQVIGSYSEYYGLDLSANIVDNSLNISYTSAISTTWIITEDEIYTYPDSGLAIISSNGKLKLSHNRLTVRSLALQTINVTRSTSNIPVISDINDNLVTYFFLDNVHWFIFEHTILASGVDNLGFHTIRRFDPLKYFKFTEKITGAIRASDTSFWVFHKDGSYLIYKSAISLADQTSYYWLCTNSAKSKGCDFLNAVTTLPVSNNIAVVTSDDISTVVLRENVATDERILVPLTLPLATNIRQLLKTTKSVVIGIYKYLAIFFLNQHEGNVVPAVIFDNVSNGWWYWEFGIAGVLSAEKTETGLKIFAKANDVNKHIVYEFTEDEYSYIVNSLTYLIYADRLNASQTPTQIDWYWQSAVQLFGTVEKRKQLLFTTFVFDDYIVDETAEQTINFGYHFDIYSREYAASEPDSTTATIYRVSNSANRTMIARFNYLQLAINNADFDISNGLENGDFTALTKPKICSVSMKYRILRGEWT